MIRLHNTCELLIKLRLTDSFYVERGGFPSLKVNGESIYFVQSFTKGYSPYKVKRSLFGTILVIPSLHQNRLRYEWGGFVANNSRGPR